MASRFYFPSSGAAAVTPSTWNFGAQINPLTFAGTKTKTSSAMTTKTEATGTTNPTARGMLRYVIGPLEGQSISGTVKGQMRCCESNAGANASVALAIKIIQPDGSDRAVVLAQTAADATTTPPEMEVSSGSTVFTNRQFNNAAESASITLSTQTATRGDYLVIELGFRSATGTSRNVSLRYGDTGGTDLSEDNTSTTDNVPWIEFSDDIDLIDKIPGVGALALAGQTPSRVVNHIMAMGVCALSLAGTNVAVAFQGPETGALAFTGHAPTVDVQTGGGSNTTIEPGVGSLTLSGQTPTLAYTLDVPSGTLTLTGLAPALAHTIPVAAGSLTLTGLEPTVLDQASGVIQVPAGSLSLTGTNVAVAFQGPETGTLAFTGYAPTLDVAAGGSNTTIPVPAGGLWLFGHTYDILFGGPGAGTLTLTGHAPTVVLQEPGETTIPVPVGALTLTGLTPTLQTSVAVPAGSLTLTGLAPTVAYTLPVPAGTLTLTGLAATVAHAIPVSAGSLTLTGHAPTVIEQAPGETTIPVPAGSLTLTGLATTIRTTVAVPMGSLTLTGHAPSLSVEAGTTLMRFIHHYRQQGIM